MTLEAQSGVELLLELRGHTDENGLVKAWSHPRQVGYWRYIQDNRCIRHLYFVEIDGTASVVTEDSPFFGESTDAAVNRTVSTYSAGTWRTFTPIQFGSWGGECIELIFS